MDFYRDYITYDVLRYRRDSLCLFICYTYADTSCRLSPACNTGGSTVSRLVGGALSEHRNNHLFGEDVHKTNIPRK